MTVKNAATQVVGLIGFMRGMRSSRARFGVGDDNGQRVMFFDCNAGRVWVVPFDLIATGDADLQRAFERFKRAIGYQMLVDGELLVPRDALPFQFLPFADYMREHRAQTLSIDLHARHFSIGLFPAAGGRFDKSIDVNVDDSLADNVDGLAAVLCDLGALCFKWRPEVPAERQRRGSVAAGGSL